MTETRIVLERIFIGRFLSRNHPFRSFVLLVGSAALWFPPLRSTVLIKVDAVPHTARVPCQEFVVPHLASGRKLLEPLGVAESADQVVLRNLANTGFEFIHAGMTAR
jgi:hypothetical protein